MFSEQGLLIFLFTFLVRTDSEGGFGSPRGEFHTKMLSLWYKATLWLGKHMSVLNLAKQTAYNDPICLFALLAP